MTERNYRVRVWNIDTATAELEDEATERQLANAVDQAHRFIERQHTVDLLAVVVAPVSR
jgi:hypothetical protein